MARALLCINGIFWIGYGVFCTFWPEVVAEFIGYKFNSADAIIEVISMYGGLEFGLGVLFLYCGIKEQETVRGLLLMFVVMGSLALWRILGLVMHGGEITIYTQYGIPYEGLVAIASGFFWYRSVFKIEKS